VSALVRLCFVSYKSFICRLYSLSSYYRVCICNLMFSRKGKVSLWDNNSDSLCRSFKTFSLLNGFSQEYERLSNRGHFTIFRFVCFWRESPQWAKASLLSRFLDRTQRRTTINRTSLDESSARGRDLYLTTHNTHNRQTSRPPVEFELTISAGERPQTYALDCAVTGTGNIARSIDKILWKVQIKVPMQALVR
jgi:hypothetical protein